MRSGDTSSTWRATTATSLVRRQRAGLLPRALGVAHVEEGLLGQVVELAVDQQLERLDRLVDGDVDALQAGELLADEERLRQEALHLAGPLHDDLVLLGQLVEAQDGDDVLQ